MRVSTLLDTVGESFELNIAAVQEAEMLTRTAKPIILPKDLCKGNGILAIPIQLRRAEIPRLVPLQFASNDSPTVPLLGLRYTVGSATGCQRQQTRFRWNRLVGSVLTRIIHEGGRRIRRAGFQAENREIFGIYVDQLFSPV
jgi:hypothetical protein